jgi:hypothetical protein
MKRVLSIVFQFLVYLIAFAAGSFLPAFHLLPTIIWHLSATRDFVITGLILSAALFVLVMIVHGVRRAHSSALLNSTVAFLFAIAAGVALHFGLLTV